MTDPILKRTTVRITYTASDGYRAETEAKGGTGSKHLKSGAEVPPENALLHGLQESARILALFGFEAQARTAFEDVLKRVASAKAARTA